MSYQILFAGDILEGHRLETVKRKFAELHRIPISQAEGYFDGRTHVVTTERDPQRVKHIQAAYTQIGIQCTVKELTPKVSSAKLSPPSLDTSPTKRTQESVSHGMKTAKTLYGTYATEEYKTTRILARIFAGVGWVFTVIGILYLFSSFVATEEEALASVIWTILGGISLFGGLILVVAGQVTRAIVDLAETNQEIVSLLKKQ